LEVQRLLFLLRAFATVAKPTRAKETAHVWASILCHDKPWRLGKVLNSKLKVSKQIKQCIGAIVG
jgi:hypothetical protein